MYETYTSYFLDNHNLDVPKHSISDIWEAHAATGSGLQNTGGFPPTMIVALSLR